MACLYQCDVCSRTALGTSTPVGFPGTQKRVEWGLPYGWEELPVQGKSRPTIEACGDCANSIKRLRTNGVRQG